MRRHSNHSNGPQGKEIPVRMAPTRKESEITLGTTLEQVAADAQSVNTEEEHDDDVAEDEDYYNNYYQPQRLNTFAFQESLPRLPIPSLDETLNKFLRHVEALTSYTTTPAPYTNNSPSPVTTTTSIPSATAQTPITKGSQKSLSQQHQQQQRQYPLPHQQQYPQSPAGVLQQYPNPDDDVQQVVLDFLKGDGPKLQELLKDYEQAGLATGVIGSYVEEFWNESNLAPDPSVVLNLNPFFVLEDGPDPKIAKDPLRRAASLCFACIKMASQLRNENVLPDTFKGQPLCMDQFKAIFGAARVPHPPDDAFEGGADDIDIYPDSGHVVVMCRNQLYYFQCLWWDGSVAVDEEDVLDILEAIQKNARQDTPAEVAATALGVLTSLDRKTWGKVRFDLSQIAMNNEYLIIIDSSLFVLVLDDYIPTSPHDAAANMLHGSYRMKSSTTSTSTTNPQQSVGSSSQPFKSPSSSKTTTTTTTTSPTNYYPSSGSHASGSTTPRHNLHNKNPTNGSSNNNNNNNTTSTTGQLLHQMGSCCNRWYDKFQIIVCGDGTAGINFEHSAIDGHTALRVVSDIYAETVINFAQSITKTIQAHQPQPHLHPMYMNHNPQHHQQQQQQHQGLHHQHQQQQQSHRHHHPQSLHRPNRRRSGGSEDNGGGGGDGARNHIESAIPHVVQAKVQRAATMVDEHGRPALDVLPKRMQFTIPASIKKQIFHAEAALGDKIVASDTVVLEFNDYGKTLITTNHLSPDAYIQMSILLAYYKLYGKVVCSYEPVLTKAFFHGRTEAMRSTTREAKDLCEAFFQTQYSPVQKLSMLRRAIQTQVQYVSECARGKGVDRHLFALKCIAERHELPIPSFFESKPWKLLNHSVLSTSNCGNPSIRLFGFGPVVPDGFGIGYIIKDKSLCYTISSKHRQTKRFAFALEGVLRSMAKLLKRSTLNASVSGPQRRVSLKKMPAIHSMGQDPPPTQSRPKSNSGSNEDPMTMPRRSLSHGSGIGMSDMWGESTSTMQEPETPSTPYNTTSRPGQQEAVASPPKPSQKNDRWSDLAITSTHVKQPLHADVSNSSLSAVSMSTTGTGQPPNHFLPNFMSPQVPPDTPGADTVSTFPTPLPPILGRSASEPVPTSTSTHSSDNMPQRPSRRASHFAGQKRMDTFSMKSLYESGVSLDLDMDDDDEDEEDSTEAGSDNLINHKYGESVGVIGECSIATFEE